jgi:hypothetical protein
VAGQEAKARRQRLEPSLTIFVNGAGWLVRINCGTVFNLLR